MIAPFDRLAALVAGMTARPWGVMRDGPRGDGEPWVAYTEGGPGMTIGSTGHTEPVARFSGYLMSSKDNALATIALVNAADELIALAMIARRIAETPYNAIPNADALRMLKDACAALDRKLAAGA